MPTFSSSADSESAERRDSEQKKVHPNVSKLLLVTVMRMRGKTSGAALASVTYSRRLEATQWTCSASGGLCKALRPHRDCRPIEGQILSIRSVISEHVTRARGRPTFQDTPSEPLPVDAHRRNHATGKTAAKPPRSADRRLPVRVGPGRPARCPRRTPGEVRRRSFVGILVQGGPTPARPSCDAPGTRDWPLAGPIQELAPDPGSLSIVPDCY